MKLETTGGTKECGLAGDFLVWDMSMDLDLSLEEEQWTPHSKARLLELDGGLEGPCIAQSKINIFLIKEDDYRHSYCMDEF